MYFSNNNQFIETPNIIYNISTSDIQELILCRYHITDWEQFAKDGCIYTYSDTLYFNFSREEIMMLLYMIYKHNCKISFYALFHEMIVVYKHLLKNTNNKYYLGILKKTGHLDVLMSDFVFILRETLDSFQIIYDYSFKNLFATRANFYFTAYFHSLKSNSYKDNGLATGSRTNKLVHEGLYEDTLIVSNKHIAPDPTDTMDSFDISSPIFQTIVTNCISKEYFKQIDYDLFVAFYGLGEEPPIMQKTLAKQYHMSRAYVCRKIKRVRDCIQLQIKMINKGAGGYKKQELDFGRG